MGCSSSKPTEPKKRPPKADSTSPPRQTKNPKVVDSPKRPPSPCDPAVIEGAVEAASLPESFVAAWVRNVEAGEKMENDAMVDLKNSVSVDISCAFVFDKQAALDALEKGVNPLLKPELPTVAVQLSLRDLANKFMSQRTEGPAKGTFSRTKAVLGTKELLPHAMRAGVFAKVSLIQGGAVT